MKIEQTFIDKNNIRRFYHPLLTKNGIKRNGERAYEIKCAECGITAFCRKASFEKNKRHFCSLICQRKTTLRENSGHYNWKGGKRIINGRAYTMVKGHHRASRDGYVPNYVLNIEKFLGRSLEKGEVVHHINMDKSNDDPFNLYVCKDNKEHKLLHWQMEKLIKDFLSKGLIKFNNGIYTI